MNPKDSVTEYNSKPKEFVYLELHGHTQAFCDESLQEVVNVQNYEGSSHLDIFHKPIESMSH